MVVDPDPDQNPEWIQGQENKAQYIRTAHFSTFFQSYHKKCLVWIWISICIGFGFNDFGDPD
jgi:hypothetical protein